MQVCTNCDFQNRPGVVFCENCGTGLLAGNASSGTKMLSESKEEPTAAPPTTPPTDEPTQRKDFIAGTPLLLEVSDGGGSLEVAYSKIIVLGRRDPSTGLKPDVDLTPFAGYRMGVSRRHAELRHLIDENVLELWDLGSSNGTHLNEERLTPHRAYRLKDGDVIRLGQLSLRLRFKVSETTDIE